MRKQLSKGPKDKKSLACSVRGVLVNVDGWLEGVGVCWSMWTVLEGVGGVLVNVDGPLDRVGRCRGREEGGMLDLES